MVQWIAILAVLVCLSGSSHSRSWVGFDDDDYFESSLADSYNEDQSRKARHYSEDDWESDEDYEDSGYYGHGYGNDRPNSRIYDRDSHSLSYHDDHGFDYHGYDHHGFGHSGSDHQYHENRGYNQHGRHNNKDVHGQNHKHGSSNSGSIQNSQGQVPHNQGHVNHGSSHAGSPGHSGQHSGARGRPSQVESSSRPGQNSAPPSQGGSQNNQNGPTSRQDADRVVFPNFNNQIPTTRGPSSPRPAVTTVPTTTSTTTNRTLLNLVLCVRACPTTPEYNPVCGSNNVTYNNPGALQCAANCGVNVALARRAPCPRFVPQSTTPASPTTSRPISTTARTAQTTPASTVPPVTTRFTNINVILSDKANTTSIPIDLLMSIFGQPSTDSQTEEAEFNADKRRKP